MLVTNFRTQCLVFYKSGDKHPKTSLFSRLQSFLIDSIVWIWKYAIFKIVFQETHMFHHTSHMHSFFWVSILISEVIGSKIMANMWKYWIWLWNTKIYDENPDASISTAPNFSVFHFLVLPRHLSETWMVRALGEKFPASQVYGDDELEMKVARTHTRKGGRTKEPILNETKSPILETGQNRRFRKWDKTADSENETKPPIKKRSFISQRSSSNFKKIQLSRMLMKKKANKIHVFIW